MEKKISKNGHITRLPARVPFMFHPDGTVQWVDDSGKFRTLLPNPSIFSVMMPTVFPFKLQETEGHEDHQERRKH